MKKLIFLLFITSCFNKQQFVVNTYKALPEEVEIITFNADNAKIFNMKHFNKLHESLSKGHKIENVNYQDKNGITPLIISTLVFRMNPSDEAIYVIKTLLNYDGIDINIKGNRGETALNILSGTDCKDREKAEELVDILLSKEGVEVNELNGDGVTSLILSIKNEERIGVFKSLMVYSEIDVNKEDRYGNSPLHLALLGDVQNIREEKVSMLLKHKDINVNKKIGASPLLHSIVRDRDKKRALSNLTLLLRHKDIDVNIVNRSDKTLLIEAIELEVDTKIIELLVDHPKIMLNVFTKDRYQIGDSALILAIKKGMKNIVVKMLEKGVNFSQKVKNKSPLKYATEEKNRFIDEKGAITNEEKYSLYLDIEQILLKKESDLSFDEYTEKGSIKRKVGFRELMYVINSKDIDKFKEMLENGIISAANIKQIKRIIKLNIDRGDFFKEINEMLLEKENS